MRLKGEGGFVPILIVFGVIGALIVGSHFWEKSHEEKGSCYDCTQEDGSPCVRVECREEVPSAITPFHRCPDCNENVPQALRDQVKPAGEN